MPFKPTTSYFSCNPGNSATTWGVYQSHNIQLYWSQPFTGASLPTLVLHEQVGPHSLRAVWKKKNTSSPSTLKGAINVYRWKFPAKTRCHSNVRLKTALDTTWPSEHNLDDFLHPSMYNFKFLLWTSTQGFFMVRYSMKETFAMLGMVSHISLCSVFGACWAS